MYQTCPKCGHTRDPHDPTPPDRCPACGLVFQKWLKMQYAEARRKPSPPVAEGEAVETPEEPDPGWKQRLRELALEPSEADPVSFYAKAAVYLLLFVWGWNFILMDYYYYVDGHRVDAAAPEIYASFLHNANLAFHEAGHVLFQPFGRFMTVLGGSLLQIMVPFGLMLWFLLREHNAFAASVGLWWTGQNFMDVAPYINDARAGQIPLIGGGPGVDRPGMHDWANLLRGTSWYTRDHELAALADWIGVLLMLAAFAWGGYLLYREYRLLRA